MAEGTRFKEFQEQQKKQEMMLVEERTMRTTREKNLQTQIEGLQSMQVTLQQTLESMQKTFQQQLQSITDQMHQYNRSKSLLGEGLLAQGDKASSSSPDFSRSIGDGPSQGNSTSVPNVEFPYFDGSDPRAWVRKSKMYFSVVSSFPEDQKVPFVVVHFRGKAKRWFQNFLEEKPMPDCDELVIAIMERFDDLEPALLSHVLLFNKEIKESWFISCFISGLREEIQGSILASKPQTFQQTVALAKRFESSVDGLLTKLNSIHKPPIHRSAPKPTQNHRNFSSPTKPPFNPRPNTAQPTRKLLTAAGIKVRRDKNLCYNCDETYVPGHRCKQRHMYLMMTEEEEEAYVSDAGCEDDCAEEVLFDDGRVSLNAINGHVSSESIRLWGNIEGKEVNILLDSGSTHCFIDVGVAQLLKTKKEYITPLMISIAGGKKLISRMVCPELKWSIQNTEFVHPVKVIKLGGCDMVLGCDWIRKHGPVTMDMENMRIKIRCMGQKIHLQAITKDNELQLIFGKSINKMFKKGGLWSIWAVEPKELPPKREIEHKIELVPNASLKKQAPYRYSHAQKGEIEPKSICISSFAG
ncbi:hypothetical protein CDL12_02037 [Handroanthus impetiginosus]|uniref:Retrotransposon gag domain-containing protein n=1 Tax=Handroanthus impetiginosus TaxID=429701 RepID=A0A2G9I659_9LAMI|nr:hypothetical protein CDL12_02037 [Handroanthus impetiginosus]